MSPVLEPYRQQIEASCRRFHVRRLEVFGSGPCATISTRHVATWDSWSSLML